MTDTIALIGAGNMGLALAGGLVKGGHAPRSIRVADTLHAAAQRLGDTLGVTVCPDNATALAGASVLVLAVKPQQMRALTRELSEVPGLAQMLVLSIAAGITTTTLAGWLGPATAIVRSMPNTPALIRRGTAALYATPEVSTAQRALATTIMGAVGQVHWLEDESQMDAVTALSGSGPAYVFRLLECLEEAGVDLGLPAPLARALALETVGGAAALAQGSPLSPSLLRVQVTSPGGTTERALQVLDEGNLDALFQRALRAARDRSRTLAEEFGAP